MSRIGGGVARVRARLGPQGSRVVLELGFALVSALPALPLFATRYLPLQDLPQHTAAVRVLADYRVPELGFERFFELSLGSTQYLSVYLLGALLAKLFGAVLALKLVVAASLIALPYAARSLLSTLDKPAAHALMLLPLAYNAHLVLGFLNFVAALPLMLFALALAVRLAEAYDRRRFIGLILVSLTCFCTHVVPYGILVMGAAWLVVSPRLKTTSSIALFALVPSLVLAGFWTFTRPAGRSLLRLASTGAEVAQYPTTSDALRELPRWLTDVFREPSDERVLVAWLLVVLAWFTLGAATPHLGEDGPRALRVRFACLAPLSFLGYWLMPRSYDFIWPIHARFPLIALIFTVLAAPRLSRAYGWGLSATAVLLAGLSTRDAYRAFQGTALETRGLTTVMRAVPEGSRVAGLMFDQVSHYVLFAPYLHAVAWIQAERGGAVQFSFVDFPSSPFRFREDVRPPKVPARWEWQPRRVDPARELRWFDYVLTRGAEAPLPGFRMLIRDGKWALWQR